MLQKRILAQKVNWPELSELWASSLCLQSVRHTTQASRSLSLMTRESQVQLLASQDPMM